MDNSGWRDVWRSPGSIPCSTQGQVSTGCSQLCSDELWLIPGLRPPQPLWAMHQHPTDLCFPVNYLNGTCIGTSCSLCLLSLHLSLNMSEKSLTLSSLEILEVCFVSSPTSLRRHWTLLIPLWGSHLTPEGNQLGQEWSVLVNPILPVLYPLLFLQVLGGDFEEDLLQKRPSTQSYPDWAAVPQILLLILPEAGCDVCQARGAFPGRHKLLKVKERVLAMTSAGSLSKLVFNWCNSINLHISALFKSPATRSNNPGANASLLHTSPLCSGLWKESLPGKNEKKQILSCSSFSAAF